MLDKLLKKKRERMQQAVHELELAKGQLISDSECILKILKDSPHPSSMQFAEVKHYFYRNRGLVSGGEGRILIALKFLSEIKAIGWAGKRGDSICFSKSVMPVSLAGMVG